MVHWIKFSVDGKKLLNGGGLQKVTGAGLAISDCVRGSALQGLRSEECLAGQSVALEFKNREELRLWLVDQPVDWAQVIAARTALCVFTRVFRAVRLPENLMGLRLKQDLNLQAFRAGLIAWAARKYPAHQMTTAANAGARAALSAAYSASHADRAAAQAADAVRAAASALVERSASDAAVRVTNDAARSASSAAYAAGAANAAGRKAVWAAVAADCEFLLKTGDPAALINTPLWQNEVRSSPSYQTNMPDWARGPMDTFLADPQWGGKPEWALIVKWYHALLPGGGSDTPRSYFGEKADIEIATRPDQFWTIGDDRGAEDILREIGEIAGVWPGEEVKQEEVEAASLAGAVVSFLEGHRRPADHFEIGDACKNVAPTSTAEGLYETLGSLVAEGAIVRLIQGDYVHPKWHKTNSAAQRAALKEQLSPDIVLDESGECLDSVPNADFDKQDYDDELPYLPEILRALINRALDALQGRNAPKGFAGALSAYMEELNARGAAVIPGVLRVEMDFIEAELASPDAELWCGAGLWKTFQTLQEKHHLLLKHYPLDRARLETFSQIDITSAKLDSREIIDQLDKVKLAVDRAFDGDLITEAYFKAVQRQIRVARDILSIARPESQKDATDDEAGAIEAKSRELKEKKKRSLAQVVGTADKSLDILTKTAKLADQPSVKAFADFLKTIPDWFWGGPPA